MTKSIRFWVGSPLLAVLVAAPLLLALGAGPARAVSHLVLPAGSPGATFNAPGELVVHVPSGTLSVPALDLRAGLTLTLNPGSGNMTLDVAGILSLCTTALLPSCLPFGDGQPDTGADPFHLTVLGPLTGPLELYAGTTLILTPDPIPEPGTGLMTALGLAGLAFFGRRGSNRVPRG